MFMPPLLVKQVLFNDSQDRVFYFAIFIAEREDGESICVYVTYLHLVKFELIY